MTGKYVSVSALSSLLAEVNAVVQEQSIRRPPDLRVRIVRETLRAIPGWPQDWTLDPQEVSATLPEND